MVVLIYIPTNSVWVSLFSRLSNICEFWIMAILTGVRWYLIVVLISTSLMISWKRLLQVPWTARRSNQSWSKDQSWVFLGRNDAEVETPILWPPHEKSWLIGKDPEAGRDWGQEEKGTTEDEMAGWHHLLDAHEFGWTPGVGDGQGGLDCCYSCGCKGSDTTERLNWTEAIINFKCVGITEIIQKMTLKYMLFQWT